MQSSGELPSEQTLEIELSRTRVYTWFAFEALLMGSSLWGAASSTSWFGHVAFLATALVQAKSLLDQRPLSGPYWIKIDAGGIEGRLPGFKKSISWDLIQRIETRGMFGAMLRIYLKRSERGSWSRMLDGRLNRGGSIELFPSTDIHRMQSFIDTHYASRMQRVTSTRHSR